MPTVDATSARKLIAQGFRHGERRLTNLGSGTFSISFACGPFAVGMKLSRGDDDARAGDAGFSTVPFRESEGLQLMLLDRRLIENEAR